MTAMATTAATVLPAWKAAPMAKPSIRLCPTRPEAASIPTPGWCWWPAYSASWPRCTGAERSITCSARKPAIAMSMTTGTPNRYPGCSPRASGSRSNSTTPSISPAARPSTKCLRSPIRSAATPPSSVVTKEPSATTTGIGHPPPGQQRHRTTVARLGLEARLRPVSLGLCDHARRLRRACLADPRQSASCQWATDAGLSSRRRLLLRLITFNIASIDGRIALSQSTPSWLDARWKPLDRYQPVDVPSLHGARVCLEGSNSFTARDAPEAVFGNAEAKVPPGDFLPEKLRTHSGRWLVVIDSRARVRWTASEQDGTKLAVLISSTTPAAYRQFLREHDVPYLETGDGRVDLRQALGRLGEAFGVNRIVSTAGGVLNGALLRASLVDEIDIQFLPAVVGRAEAPAIFAGYDFGAAGNPCDLQLISTESRPDGSIFIRYAVR